MTQLSDADLAAHYAPHLMLDRNEPYRPHAFGYTIFRAPGQSPSSKFVIPMEFTKLLGQVGQYLDQSLQSSEDVPAARPTLNGEVQGPREPVGRP